MPTIEDPEQWPGKSAAESDSQCFELLADTALANCVESSGTLPVEERITIMPTVSRRVFLVNADAETDLAIELRLCSLRTWR